MTTQNTPTASARKAASDACRRQSVSEPAQRKVVRQYVRQVVIVVFDDGTEEMTGVSLGHMPGFDIVGSGTLQNPLRVVTTN